MSQTSTQEQWEFTVKELLSDIWTPRICTGNRMFCKCDFYHDTNVTVPCPPLTRDIAMRLLEAMGKLRRDKTLPDIWMGIDSEGHYCAVGEISDYSLWAEGHADNIIDAIAAAAYELAKAENSLHVEKS